MALPIVAASFVGGIVAGLAQFAASKAGLILAGLGLTFIGVKSLEAFIGYVIADMQQVIALAQQAGGAVGGSAGVSNLAYQAMQFAAYAGLFDALNIVISGYMAYVSLMSVRFIVGRLK
jgi:hypothetical protein